MKMKPKARTLNLVIQEAAGETLVYDLVKNKAFCLNETCASVWKKCDGTLGIGEIAVAMSKEIGTTVSNDVVFLALEELKKNEIVSDFDGEYPQFDGLSRRDVIRKVGFASMIALPVVSSIVAPKAAFAQSCVGAGTVAPGTSVGIIACPRPGPLCTDCTAFDANCCSGTANVNSGSCNQTIPNFHDCTCVCG